MNEKKNQSWVDINFGKRGLAAWCILIAWVYFVFFIYPSVFLAENGLDKQAIIYYFFNLLALMLVVSPLLFFYQCIKTAQRLNIKDNMHVEALMYFGRKLKFNINDVVDIQSFFPSWFQNIYTPFVTSHKNYKITLEDGRKLCISGSMGNVEELIGILEPDRLG